MVGKFLYLSASIRRLVRVSFVKVSLLGVVRSVYFLRKGSLYWIGVVFMVAGSLANLEESFSTTLM